MMDDRYDSERALRGYRTRPHSRFVQGRMDAPDMGEGCGRAIIETVCDRLKLSRGEAAAYIPSRGRE